MDYAFGVEFTFAQVLLELSIRHMANVEVIQRVLAAGSQIPF